MGIENSRLAEIVRKVGERSQREAEEAKKFKTGNGVEPINTDLHRPYAHLGIPGTVLDVLRDGTVLVDFGEDKIGAYSPLGLKHLDKEE